MQLSSKILTCVLINMFILYRMGLAREPPLNVKDVEQVREAVHVLDYDREQLRRLEYLIYMGEKVFPTYELILSDPNATPHDIAGVLGLLRSVEGDRSRFLKHTVSELMHAHRGVRRIAVELLERIGSSTEASQVIALLSDKETDVVYSAARTLRAIGGPNEVIAMDVWLRGITYSDDNHLRQYIQKCRHELKNRLEQINDSGKRERLRQQLWEDMSSAKSVKVHLAVYNLTAFGVETVAFLKEHLHPVPTGIQIHLAQLLTDLDSDSFDRREAASRELARGVVADSVVEKALVNRPSLELRRRLEPISDDMFYWKSKNPELLRQIRAVWVLQQIGTPEAKALLEKVATGAPSARLTQKAKDALQSLERLQKH